jgi:hypothetical protein
MSNLNLSIELTKLPGAKVMNIQGDRETRQCVVIPIDNKVGIISNGYMGKDPQTGLPMEKLFDNVKLNLVGIQYREPKYGATHGLKASFATEYMQRMTEEQLRAMPWLGNVKPWAQPTSKAQDDDDLPEANDSNW